MKNIFLFLSIAVAAGMLFVNVYTSLVDARSWGSDMPQSIAAAREYFKSVNPGNFFRVFSPVNQVLGLLVLILFWRTSPTIRMCLGAALVLYILVDVMTFAYFYPRNDILFKTAALTDVETLRKTWAEWNAMNWVRSLMLLIGVGLACFSLHKVYAVRG
jgi:hypothetical protein